MVLDVMKRILKTIFLIALTAFFSCEEQGIFVNCSDCKTEQPFDTSLEIKLDQSTTVGGTIINIYQGNLEDSVLYGTFSSFAKSTTYTVIVNKKYTVTASYYINNKQYIAVDAATPRVKYTKDDCDDPCYLVYDKKVDLRLK
jgi:hypothetical protein